MPLQQEFCSEKESKQTPNLSELTSSCMSNSSRTTRWKRGPSAVQPLGPELWRWAIQACRDLLGRHEKVQGLGTHTANSRFSSGFSGSSSSLGLSEQQLLEGFLLLFLQLLSPLPSTSILSLHCLFASQSISTSRLLGKAEERSLDSLALLPARARTTPVPSPCLEMSTQIERPHPW